MQYSHLQATRVMELKIGQELHSGMTADTCMKWFVVGIEGGYAHMRIASKDRGSLVIVTGKQIREFGMYWADTCPFCKKLEQATQAIVEQDKNLFPGEIEPSSVESSFVFRNALLVGVARKQGGAFLRRNSRGN